MTFFLNFSMLHIHTAMQRCEDQKSILRSMFVQVRTHDLLAEYGGAIFTAHHALSFNCNMARIALKRPNTVGLAVYLKVE
jgi:hypothetical protein